MEKNIHIFLYHRYKFIENDKIEEGSLLNATNTSLDSHESHLEKCGIDSFKKLEHSLIHTFWPGHGEDIENEDDDMVEEDVVEETEDLIETQYFNGNNEVVKIFNQKCVVCYERESVMHLDNVVINVVAKTVIIIKVILIY